MKARLLLMALLLGRCQAQEIFLDEPSPARVQQLRRQLSRHRSAYLCQELALQLVASGGPQREILSLFQEAYQRKPDAQNRFYLSRLSPQLKERQRYLREALAQAPHSLSLLSLAREEQLPDCPELRRARALQESWSDPSQDPRGPGPVSERRAKTPSRSLDIQAHEVRVLDRQGNRLAQWPTRVPIDCFQGSSDAEDRQPTRDLTQTDASSELGREVMVLHRYWEFTLVDLRTGRGWCLFSGGDRHPSGQVWLSEDEQFLIHYGPRWVTCYDSRSGRMAWNYLPQRMTALQPWIIEKGQLWVFEEATGKVVGLDLKSGKVGWRKPHWEVRRDLRTGGVKGG